MEVKNLQDNVTTNISLKAKDLGMSLLKNLSSKDPAPYLLFDVF